MNTNVTPICPVCRETKVGDKTFLPCGHVLCTPCHDEYMEHWDTHGPANGEDVWKCQSCFFNNNEANARVCVECKEQAYARCPECRKPIREYEDDIGDVDSPPSPSYSPPSPSYSPPSPSYSPTPPSTSSSSSSSDVVPYALTSNSSSNSSSAVVPYALTSNSSSAVVPFRRAMHDITTELNMDIPVHQAPSIATMESCVRERRKIEENSPRPITRASIRACRKRIRAYPYKKKQREDKLRDLQQKFLKESRLAEKQYQDDLAQEELHKLWEKASDRIDENRAVTAYDK